MHSDLIPKLAGFKFFTGLIVIGLALSACSGKLQPFGKKTKPFSLSLRKKPPVIKIGKIQGLLAGNSKSLRRQIIFEAGKRGIPAGSNAKGKAEIFVNGSMKVAPFGQNTAVAYVWNVSDGKNNRLLRVTGEDISQKNLGRKKTNTLNVATVQRIAAHAASSLAVWLGKQGYEVREISLPPPNDVRNLKTLRAQASSENARQAITRNLYKATGSPRQRVVELSSPQIALPAVESMREDGAPDVTSSLSSQRARPPDNRQTQLRVTMVKGASPRANRELTQAIKRALRSKGVRITEKPTPSSLDLVGIVKVGPVQRQRRAIAIDWHLNRSTGERIGLIQQNNKVKASLIAGSWGQTADLAAQAAATDIARTIFNRKKASRR